MFTALVTQIVVSKTHRTCRATHRIRTNECKADSSAAGKIIPAQYSAHEKLHWYGYLSRKKAASYRGQLWKRGRHTQGDIQIPAPGEADSWKPGNLIVVSNQQIIRQYNPCEDYRQKQVYRTEPNKPNQSKHIRPRKCSSRDIVYWSRADYHLSNWPGV